MHVYAYIYLYLYLYSICRQFGVEHGNDLNPP